MTTSGTTSDNEWQRVKTSDTTSDNEWYNELQRATASDKEWQRVVQRVTTNEKVWPFRLFKKKKKREEPTTKHPNSLNLWEDLWGRPIELRAETSTQEKILTVRSRNRRSSCSQIFLKISVLKNFAIFTGKHQCWSPFYRKLQVLKPAQVYQKETPTQVFSCEYCEIFKNSFLYRTTMVVASGIETFF